MMEFRSYIENEILPLYRNFDRAHGPEHAEAVISRSLALAEIYGLDQDMVYAAAAYHDTGLTEGRERHHLVSGRIIREDMNLRNWFSEEQIETIAQAAEDHRASADREPRSIYGRIIADSPTPDDYINRGHALLALKHTKEAVDDYRKAASQIGVDKVAATMEADSRYLSAAEIDNSLLHMIIDKLHYDLA